MSTPAFLRGVKSHLRNDVRVVFYIIPITFRLMHKECLDLVSLV